MNKPAPRATWMAVHRYFGLTAMLLLGFAAITGCLLCFIRPLDATLNADLFKAAPVSAPIDVSLAVDRYQRSHPEVFVRSFPLTVAADRTIAVKVEASRKTAAIGFDQVFLDRADGHVVGHRIDDAAWNRRGAMVLLHDIHYTLLAGDPGKWLMGAIALGWLVSNLVGVYLTTPSRGPFWRNWTRAWRFSVRSSTPRMLLDMHRSSGLWLTGPLAALAFTSIALNFFTIAYDPLIDRVAPPRPSRLEARAVSPHGVGGTMGFARTVRIASRLAQARHETWIPATALYQPARQAYGVTFTDDGLLNYRLLGPVYYYLDGADGHLIDIASPYDANTGLALIRMLYPVHSGRIAGPIGVTVVFLLGLVTVGQCGTGLYLWFKKRRSRLPSTRRRQSRP